MTPEAYKTEQITSNFRRSEFACKGTNCCGGSAPIDMKLVSYLENYRIHSGNKPVRITNGFRCLVHNKEVGSEDTSQHPKGRAVDIAAQPGQTIDDMAVWAEESGFDGIITYDWGIHVDIRGHYYRDDRRGR